MDNYIKNNVECLIKNKLSLKHDFYYCQNTYVNSYNNAFFKLKIFHYSKKRLKS